MDKIWSDDAWNDYLAWQQQDRKTLRRINRLIKDIDRSGSTGIGKAEILKGNYSGWFSRKIDKKNRLVYKIKDNQLLIVACKNHY